MIFLWIYLTGMGVFVFLSHGLLQSPKLTDGANVSGVMANAILWPLFVTISMFRVFFK